MSNRGRLLAVLLAAAALAPLSGCMTFSDRFGGASWDKHVYVSTPDMPQTVSLIDTRTGQTVWACEIPVGSQLVIQFVQERARPGAVPVDQMQWAVMPINASFRGLTNVMPVPPAESRRLDGELRPGAALAELDRPAAPTLPAPPAAPAVVPAVAPAPAPAASTPAARTTPAGIVLPDPKQPNPDAPRRPAAPPPPPAPAPTPENPAPKDPPIDLP